MDHRSGCRLDVEVQSRLLAIQRACLWSEPTAFEKVDAVEKLAGWAGAHLAVLFEHGFSCVDEPSRAA